MSISRSSPLWLSLVLLLGCPRPADQRTGDAAPSASAATTTATAASAMPTASSSAVSQVEDDGVIIVISRAAVLVGEEGDPVMKVPAKQTAGFPVEYKRQGAEDLFLKPLAARLDKDKANRTSNEATIIADGDTAYRILIEVLYTLGQSSIGKYHLMIMKRDGTPSKKVAKPPAKIADQPDMPEATKGLHLSVTITAEGFSVKAFGKNFAPGCKDFGDGLTIPKGPNAHTELSRCAARIKKRSPTDASVVISAEPDTRYAVILEVVDTLRNAADGELYPDVRFGVLR